MPYARFALCPLKILENVLRQRRIKIIGDDEISCAYSERARLTEADGKILPEPAGWLDLCQRLLGFQNQKRFPGLNAVQITH